MARTEAGSTVLVQGVLHAAVLVAVCALLWLPGLGSGGLAATEGHRTIPAYAMLDSGNWITPTMFERPYLRKPPGIQWAIGLSSEVLGRTEFAARFPSVLAATVTALLAFGFSWRWFGLMHRGVPIALGGGLAFALVPWFWESHRAAEIEALNNLWTVAAAWLMLDRVQRRPDQRRSAGSAVRTVLLLGAAVGLMLLTKGPAGAPTLAGALLAAALVQRSFKPLATVSVWVGVLLGVGVFVGWALLVRQNLATFTDSADPIRQSPAAFLFEDGFTLAQLTRVLALGPTALVFALPMTLALLFPWGPDARQEAEQSTTEERSHTNSASVDAACRTLGVLRPIQRWQMARTLTLTGVLALALLTLTGVDNPRYALPIVVVFPPVVASVLRLLADSPDPVGLLPKRAAIARAMLLWVPVGRRAEQPHAGTSLWLPILFVLGLVYPHTLEATIRATSGREAGQQMARAIAAWPGGTPSVIYCDGMIEARPETLLAATQARHAANLDLGVLDADQIRGVWAPLADLEPEGSFLVLRRPASEPVVAGMSPESLLGVNEAGIPDWQVHVLDQGTVHKFDYVLELWEWTPRAADSDPNTP